PYLQALPHVSTLFLTGHTEGSNRDRKRRTRQMGHPCDGVSKCLRGADYRRQPRIWPRGQHIRQAGGQPPHPQLRRGISACTLARNRPALAGRVRQASRASVPTGRAASRSSGGDGNQRYRHDDVFWNRRGDLSANQCGGGMKLANRTLLNPNVPHHPGYSGKLKAVILDWAGTTVDFGSLAPVRTLQRVFDSAGLPITEAGARRRMGIQKKDHIRAILTCDRVREGWTQLRNKPPSESDVESLYQQFIPLQFSCLLEYSTLISGVPEAAERFRHRGLKIGTSTGYTREMLDILVSSAAKSGYSADCNLCPDDVGPGRPHPFMIFQN